MAQFVTAAYTLEIGGQVRALKVRQISPAQVLVDFPIIKGHAAVSIYPGIGTQAETGVRNGWYRAPDLNLRPSWAPFA